MARSHHRGFLLPVMIPFLCASKELQMQHSGSLSSQPMLLACLRGTTGMYDWNCFGDSNCTPNVLVYFRSIQVGTTSTSSVHHIAMACIVFSILNIDCRLCGFEKSQPVGQTQLSCKIVPCSDHRNPHLVLYTRFPMWHLGQPHPFGATQLTKPKRWSDFCLGNAIVAK